MHSAPPFRDWFAIGYHAVAERFDAVAPQTPSPRQARVLALTRACAVQSGIYDSATEYPADNMLEPAMAAGGSLAYRQALTLAELDGQELPDAWALLAVLGCIHGDLATATALCDRAAHGHDPLLRELVSGCLALTCGQIDDAEALFARLRGEHGDRPAELCFLHGVALRAQDRHAAAAAAFDVFAAAHPEAFLGHAFAGTCHATADENEAAVRCARRAHLRDPRRAWTLQTFNTAGAPEALLDLLARGTPPKTELGLLAVAKALDATGRHEEASDLFDLSMERHGVSAQLLLERGWQALLRGDADACERDFRRAFDIAQDADTLAALVEALLMLGRAEAARADLAAYPGEPDPILEIMERIASAMLGIEPAAPLEVDLETLTWQFEPLCQAVAAQPLPPRARDLARAIFAQLEVPWPENAPDSAAG